jgi:hypothetical protein
VTSFTASSTSDEAGSLQTARLQTTRRPPLALAGAVTGIGSLPFTCETAAIDAVAEFSPEVPFWPQLPRRSMEESVIGQGFGIVADLVEPRRGGYGYQVREGCIDLVVDALHQSSGHLTPANAVGFHAFEHATASQFFPSALAVKGHVEGPITLAAYLFHKDRPFLSDPTLFAAIAFHISQMVCWQIERLKTAALPVLLFVDEPALCLKATAASGTSAKGTSEDQRLSALAAILEDARMRGAFAGLHCCADRPFERMCLAKPDIVSFDAHQGLELFFANRYALDFLDNGGWVAYGLVPTWTGLDSVSSVGLFTRWLKCASLAGDPQELAQRAMITATCGLGLLDTSSVAGSFNLASGTGKLLKRLAGASHEEAR